MTDSDTFPTFSLGCSRQDSAGFLVKVPLTTPWAPYILPSRLLTKLIVSALLCCSGAVFPLPSQPFFSFFLVRRRPKSRYTGVLSIADRRRLPSPFTSLANDPFAKIDLIQLQAHQDVAEICCSHRTRFFPCPCPSYPSRGASRYVVHNISVTSSLTPLHYHRTLP